MLPCTKINISINKKKKKTILHHRVGNSVVFIYRAIVTVLRFRCKVVFIL